MSDGAPELEDSEIVFRFGPPPDAFVPSGQNLKNWNLFNPSSSDKEDAQRRGTNVRVTVWDLALTTAEQAKKIWDQHREVAAYALGLVDVFAIRELCRKERLRIVRDPLPPSAGSGYEGHCGFEGLDRQPGENKKAYKTLLDELAQRCFEIARM